ncbi:MAG: helix-turn-helix transcriptional regulator [Dethiobacter sp.]|nr:helix-turn-helix transcriptional regulator [Dethiobacter sp.]
MTGELKKLLAVRVRELREFRGLSQKKLANRVGMGSSSISDIENGKRNVTFETVEKIAQELGVKATELLGAKTGESDLPAVLTETEGRYPTIPESVISVYKDFSGHGIAFEHPEDYYYLWLVMEALGDKNSKRRRR